MIVTKTQKQEAAVEMLSSKVLINELFQHIGNFSDIEKLYSRVAYCYEIAKVEESKKVESLESLKDKAKELKSILDGAGLSMDDFNNMMALVSNSKAGSKKDPNQPKRKNKVKVCVLRYEENGVEKRTPLKSIVGRKSKEVSEYMAQQGLNPFKTEDCMLLVVAPTPEEIAAYGGDESLIIRPEN